MRSAEFIRGLIGRPWEANAEGPDAFDCYGLVRYVQRELFGRDLPSVHTVEPYTWRGMIDAIASHPERARWREVEQQQRTLMPDGAVVLLASVRMPAHMGVWFRGFGSILHADRPLGVAFQTFAEMRALGWHRALFMEPLE